MPIQILLIESSTSKQQSIKPLLSLQFPSVKIKCITNSMKSLSALAQEPGIRPGESLVVIDLDLASLEGIGFMESYSRTDHYRSSRLIIVSQNGEMEIPKTYENHARTQYITRKQAKEIRECLVAHCQS